MRVSFCTLGCKINQFYTECLKQKNIEEGNDVVSLEEKPDIAYVNTCAVTARAGSEGRKLYRKAKRNAKEVRILGCQAKLFPEDFEEKSYIDEKTLTHNGFKPTSSRTRPYLPIQFGCNNFCTYCIVPYARGKSYSLPINTIIKNTKNLIGNGYREIVLTGINIGNYQYRGKNLKNLLKELLKLDIRIRLTSIMPDCLDWEFIRLFENPHLMPHVHLSQQSGSDKILKRMRRKYVREKTLLVAQQLRKIREEIRLAGDFIVGFPGENQEDFKDTVNLIKKADFSHLHIFRYSQRPYTLASLYPAQVQDSIKKERANILKNLGELQRARFIRKSIGKVYQIIIEENENFGKNWATGMTPNYIKVHFPLNGKKKDIVPVKILKFENGLVYGKTKE
jgi:threonylcarbamoyladenosine tRNA methylthiotransferase MtaB